MQCDTIAQSCIFNEDAGPEGAMTRNAIFTTSEQEIGLPYL